MALKRFRAPPLPYPGPLYTAEQQRALVRNLELYFGQLDSKTPNFAESYTADFFYGGSFFETAESFTADGSLSDTASIALVDASGGAVTITLPAAATVTGRILTLKKTDTTSLPMIIDADGSETIDGGTTARVETPYVALKLYSDGTEWWII